MPDIWEQVWKDALLITFSSTVELTGWSRY